MNRKHFEGGLFDQLNGVDKVSPHQSSKLIAAVNKVNKEAIELNTTINSGSVYRRYLDECCISHATVKAAIVTDESSTFINHDRKYKTCFLV